MNHNLWDRMMYRLLQEKKEKEVKAAKAKGSKPDFLDLDKDGDKEEPMSKAAKEAGGKEKPKAKKGKGKIPPQLRMHIKKKQAKKNKLDEAIERLEKILIENLDEEQADAALEEYGEEREPDPAEQELDDYNWDDHEETCPMCDKPEEECECDSDSNWNEDDDKQWPDESFESEEASEEDSDGFSDMMEEVEYLSESEVKKKKPRLGKVTRNPSGSKKKFHVYVKCGGRVKKISFGDPGLSIKRDSPARRKNFRARHKCDKPAGKDRCTARYWSCYQWRAGKKVEGE
jgi:hypothetical protein